MQFLHRIKNSSQLANLITIFAYCFRLKSNLFEVLITNPSSSFKATSRLSGPFFPKSFTVYLLSASSLNTTRPQSTGEAEKSTRKLISRSLLLECRSLLITIHDLLQWVSFVPPAGPVGQPSPPRCVVWRVRGIDVNCQRCQVRRSRKCCAFFQRERSAETQLLLAPA